MAKFQIPEPFQPGFAALANLSRQEVNDLADLLREMPVGTGPQAFQEILASKSNLDEIRDISRTLFSFGSTMASYDGTINELANELANSYIEQIDKGKNLNLEELEETLVKLFQDCRNIKLTFKALELLSENNQIFKESRIVSDIRLVFNDEMLDSKRNAVILHQLRIEFRKNNEDEYFFTTLDSLDLQKLKLQIDRALEKEKLIKDNYKETISFIEIGD